MEFQLRQFSYLSNSQDIENILSDDVVAKPIGFPYGPNIDKVKVEVDKYIDECVILYEVVANGEVIGFVGFTDPRERDLQRLYRHEGIANDNGTIQMISESALEVSYALRSDYIGKGLGPKAVNAAIQKVFKYHKCSCIVALYGVFRDIGENTRSSGLLKRLGFEPFATYQHFKLCSGDEISAKVCYLLNPAVKQKYEVESDAGESAQQGENIHERGINRERDV